MSELIQLIPGWVWVLVALCAVVLVVILAWGTFWFLVQVGVVINEARKPPHIDAGDYRIEQGREVRPEEGARRRESER